MPITSPLEFARGPPLLPEFIASSAESRAGRPIWPGR